jgi:hypothetical protein
VYHSHGGDAVLAVVEGCKDFLVLDMARLQMEQTGDDLQIVFDSVVDLLEQDFLFFE